jgi:hypothetical protein
MALGAPSRAQRRREFAPRVLRLRNRHWAASYKSVAPRFATLRVQRFKTLPRLMQLSGHSPSHLLKLCSVQRSFLIIVVPKRRCGKQLLPCRLVFCKTNPHGQSEVPAE